MVAMKVTSECINCSKLIQTSLSVLNKNKLFYYMYKQISYLWNTRSKK